MNLESPLRKDATEGASVTVVGRLVQKGIVLGGGGEAILVNITIRPVLPKTQRVGSSWSMSGFA